MDKKTVKNYIYNLIYQIFLVISPAITMPFLSRSLGVNGIGEYSYAYSLISYFVLVATLGCDVYGRREISYVKDDIDARTKKFWTIQIIKTISTFFVLIAYLIFSLFNPNKVILLLLIFHLINVPLNIGWFFQGIEEFKKITIRGFFLKIIDLSFVLIFIHSPEDLNLYTFGSSFIAFITFLVLWIDIKKYLGKFSIKKIKILPDLKEGIIFFLPSIATSIYTLLDKTMLGILTGAYIENGYYEQAQKINIILLRIVLALGTVLIPQIANAFKKKDFNTIRKSIEKTTNYVFFVSFAISFGLIAISDIFVPWFFGYEFSKVSILLKISGFILIFQGLEDVFGMQYLVSIGRQKDYIISLFIGAFINFLCNIFFIIKFQSVGAVIASLIGEIVIVLVQIVMIGNELNFKNIFLKAKNYLLAGVLMCIPCYLISLKMSANILNTFIIVLIGGIVYLLTLIILKDALLINILCSVNSKIKKHLNK